MEGSPPPHDCMKFNFSCFSFFSLREQEEKRWMVGKSFILTVISRRQELNQGGQRGTCPFFEPPSFFFLLRKCFDGKVLLKMLLTFDLCILSLFFCPLVRKFSPLVTSFCVFFVLALFLIKEIFTLHASLSMNKILRW